MEYCVQLGGPQQKALIKRGGDLGLFSLQKEFSLQGDLIAALQYQKGVYRKAGDTLSVNVVIGQGAMSLNLKEGKFRLGFKKKFFTQGVMRHWHSVEEHL